MNYMILVWLAIAVIAIVCEGATMALVSFWFAPGALISLVLAAFDVHVWIQVLVFLGVSVALVAIFQKLFRKKLGVSKKTATNVDLIMGGKAVVTEKIDNIRAIGCVKIDGQVWSARSENGEVIEENEIVEVISVSGVKLVCRKI